ncbi:hypothetical protein Tco_0362743 [Tanacetum coccineum]
MSNTNNNLQTRTSNDLHNVIIEVGGKDCPSMLAPVTEGSSETTTEGYIENYKNMSQDIRNQLDAKAEAVQIILTGIDNDIYSTVDACPNACEMWKAIKRLKQEWQRFVTLVKQCHELKIVSYHKLYDILKQHQNEVNEIRAERLAHTANPLALVAQQQSAYHPQNDPTHYTHNSLTRSQQAATRNRGKAIVNSSTPTYDQEPTMVADDDEMIILQGLTEALEEAGFHLNAEKADWRDDTDDEPDDQELEAHCIEHHEQPESVNDTYLEEQGDTNITIDSMDMSTNRETGLPNLKKFQAELDRYHDVNYASKINDLNQTISEMKKELFSHQETISIMSQEKEAQKKFHKTREDKELEKVIALEIKIKVLDDIVYKTSQLVQTMNMLNRNCKTSFVKHEFLKKAQRAHPHLYDIGCYDDNLALMLAPESDKMIRLA